MSFNNDTGTQDIKGAVFNRKSVVGLSGNFGTLLIGNQTDMLDDASGLTSVLDFGSVVGMTTHNFDRLGGIRVSNSIRYNTPDLSGFIGSVIYGLGEQAGNASASQSFGLGSIYKNGALGLYAGYFQAKLGRTPIDALVANLVTLIPENVVPSSDFDGKIASRIVNLGAIPSWSYALVWQLVAF